MNDVVVIGAGPSGTSTARVAAQKGLTTVILDKAKFPRDKPCGGALSKRTVDLLGSHAKHTLNTVINESYLWSPSFLAVKNECPNAGYYVLRETFDYAMLQDAQTAGAEVVEQTPAQKIRVNNDHVEVQTSNQTIRAKTAVLAD